jgi:hypothetical protein
LQWSEGDADRILDAQEKFKELLKALTPLLKSYGYARRGQNFRRQKGGNWDMLFFQKGKWNTKTELEFTVNLGIFSRAIDNFYQEWGKETPPEWGYDHWRKRIGSLLPGGRDKWWVIDASTELPKLIEELKSVLPLAIAEVEKYIRDEDFRDYFLADPHNCGGYVNQHRLKCLAVLVTVYGPPEKLPAIFAEWRACPTYTIYEDVRQEIESHIERLKQIAAAKVLQPGSAV